MLRSVIGRSTFHHPPPAESVKPDTGRASAFITRRVGEFPVMRSRVNNVFKAACSARSDRMPAGFFAIK